jgi:hypothetical protein
VLALRVLALRVLALRVLALREGLLQLQGRRAEPHPARRWVPELLAASVVELATLANWSPGSSW